MADDTSTGSTGSGSETRPPRTTATKKAPSAATSTLAKTTATRRKAASTNRKTAAAKRKPANTARKRAGGTTTAIARKPAARSSGAATPAKATSKPRVAKKTEVIVAPAAFDAHVGPMTATIAVTRHLEWLDYALAAARAEESWRRDRLAKATKGNLAKRETRLAEVLAEIVELSALIIGLRDLQRGAASRTSTRSGSTVARRSGTAPRARQTTDTGAG